MRARADDAGPDDDRRPDPVEEVVEEVLEAVADLLRERRLLESEVLLIRAISEIAESSRDVAGSRKLLVTAAARLVCVVVAADLADNADPPEDLDPYLGDAP